MTYFFLPLKEFQIKMFACGRCVIKTNKKNQTNRQKILVAIIVKISILNLHILIKCAFVDEMNDVIKLLILKFFYPTLKI